MNDKKKRGMMLSSTHSTQISLEAVRSGEAGLNAHRTSLLAKVSSRGEWFSFPKESISTKDIAYLTAAIGDEFAILRGKKEDVLFHGAPTTCVFEGILIDLLENKKLKLYAHSHPGGYMPTPSADDRNFLKKIGQESSIVVSAVSGHEVSFTGNMFDS